MIETDWVQLNNKYAQNVTQWVDETVVSVSKPNAFSEIMKNEKT